MAKKKVAPPIPEIQEKTLTVFEFDGETYTSREDAERAVMMQKITRLIDDSLNETDLYRDDVVEWIATHLEELLELRSNL